jgi:hypothetical protein
MGSSDTVSRILDVYPHLEAGTIERQLGWGSFASLEHRFLYLEVPKAACTSMKLLLRELGGSPPLNPFGRITRESRRRMFIHDRSNIPFPPVTALEKQEQRDLLEAPDVLRFIIVRNPYSRLVSAWRDKVYLCEPGIEDMYAAIRGGPPELDRKSPIELEELIAHLERTTDRLWDIHWRRQVDLTFAKAIGFTHVGRCESLDATTDLLARHLERPEGLTLPRANEGVIKPAAHITDDIARRIHALYREDFETFGYGADTWPSDGQDTPGNVTTECFVDEMLERNVILAYLYDERERLYRERERMAKRYDATYRFSLERVKRTLLKMMGSDGAS